jgi:uncharacterized short protein YbdD (DUF466 family)
MIRAAFLALSSAVVIGAVTLLPAHGQTPKQQALRDCIAKWNELKAGNQTEGKSYRDFIKECRAEAQPGAPTSTAAGAEPAAKPARGARKACNDRWTAEKASIRASGKTKKEFMDECLKGTAEAPSGSGATAEKSEPAAKPARGARKACNEHWTAEKASIRASGKTKKEFMDECLKGTAETPSAPAATAEKSEPAARPERGARKACNDRWTADKASIRASGRTKKEFIDECLKGTAEAPGPGPVTGSRQVPSGTAPLGTPESKPAPERPTTEAAAPPPSGSEPSSTPAPRTRRAKPGQPAAANEFSDEAQAKAACPNDTVVWVNLDSKIYHFSGYADYGHTKKGAYMCERETASAGFRAAKNEKHP